MFQQIQNQNINNGINQSQNGINMINKSLYNNNNYQIQNKNNINSNNNFLIDLLQNSNYNNIKQPFIKIEKNVLGYQIFSKNIKFNSLIDVQNIGNQNMNTIPKLNFTNDQEICINLFNINYQGIQTCQTIAKKRN